MDNIDFSSNKAVLNTSLLIAFIIGVVVLTDASIDDQTKILYGLMLTLIIIVYTVSIVYGNSYCKVDYPLCESPVIQDFEMSKLDDYVGKSAEIAGMTVVCNPLKPKQLQLQKTSLLTYTIIVIVLCLVWYMVFLNRSKEEIKTKNLPNEMVVYYVVATLTWVTYLTNYKAISIGLILVLLTILFYSLLGGDNIGIFAVIGILALISVYFNRAELSVGYTAKYFTKIYIYIIGIIMTTIILYLLYIAKKGDGSVILYTVIAGYIIVFLYIIKLYFQCILKSYYCEPKIKLSPVKNETNTDIHIACEAKYI